MNQTLQKHRFLITGATGFIGANLLHYLVRQNCEVHILMRQQSKTWRIKNIIKQVGVHYSDLTSQSQLTRQLHRIQPTIIYHLAAYGAYPHQTDRTLINQTNYLGTLNLLQASLQIPYSLFINTGSSSEYGFKSQPMSESDLPKPYSDYAVSKVASTMLCSHFANQEQKPVVTVRPFSVYGPWEEPNRLIPNVMKALHTGQPLSLVSPHTARDFIYIDDVIKFYLSINALAKMGGKYFNMGTGRQSTIQSLIEAAQQVTKKDINCHWGSMPARSWDSNCWVANMNQTHQLTGWRAKHTLEQGLKKTWLWYKQNYQIYE